MTFQCLDGPMSTLTMPLKFTSMPKCWTTTLHWELTRSQSRQSSTDQPWIRSLSRWGTQELVIQTSGPTTVFSLPTLQSSPRSLAIILSRFVSRGTISHATLWPIVFTMSKPPDSIWGRMSPIPLTTFSRPAELLIWRLKDLSRSRFLCRFLGPHLVEISTKVEPIDMK